VGSQSEVRLQLRRFWEAGFRPESDSGDEGSLNRLGCANQEIAREE